MLLNADPFLPQLKLAFAVPGGVHKFVSGITTGKGALVGAGLGAAKGLLTDPGTNPDGTPRSRLGAAATGALGGAAVGGAAGYLNQKYLVPNMQVKGVGGGAPKPSSQNPATPKVNRAVPQGTKVETPELRQWNEQRTSVKVKGADARLKEIDAQLAQPHLVNPVTPEHIAQANQLRKVRGQVAANLDMEIRNAGNTTVGEAVEKGQGGKKRYEKKAELFISESKFAQMVTDLNAGRAPEGAKPVIYEIIKRAQAAGVEPTAELVAVNLIKYAARKLQAAERKMDDDLNHDLPGKLDAEAPESVKSDFKAPKMSAKACKA